MALPIGGFMPIPLAMMIPFMATQSMVMGDAFGRAFQYGKRKISAMSNEEFNATTIEEQAANMFKSYKLIIPKLNDAIDDSSELQRKIISEMLLILPKFISETGTQIFGGTDIKTIPTTDNPPASTSSDVTSISQDAQGNVTTTSKKVNSELVRYYENNVRVVQLRLNQSEIELRTALARRGGKTGTFTNSIQKEVNLLKAELAQQKRFLANVKQGLNPY